MLDFRCLKSALLQLEISRHPQVQVTSGHCYSTAKLVSFFGVGHLCSSPQSITSSLRGCSQPESAAEPAVGACVAHDHLRMQSCMTASQSTGVKLAQREAEVTKPEQGVVM